MASAEIDAYLDGLPEPKRSTLQQLRAQILEELPDAEECISYTFPASIPLISNCPFVSVIAWSVRHFPSFDDAE